ncbi:MAG: hypothetical protein GWN58_40470 [Anaerolineae bacterium]|nr:hypothetical protein [Anaerolineae bacterium]
MQVRVRTMSGLLFLLCALLLLGCGGARIEPTPYPDEVDWETAVEILNSGDVEMAAQLHNLTVTLTLKDGTVIRTVEPIIDAIFEEVEKCGRPCNGIGLATE